MAYIVPMDSNDAFAAALGKLVARWGMLESELIGVLGWLLGVEQTRATLVFNTFAGIGQKLQLIERLANIYLEDQAAIAKITKLMHRALELNTQRNNFVHAAWGADTPPAMKLISSVLSNKRDRRYGKFGSITLDDMKNTGDEVSRFAEELLRFRIGDAAKIRVSPQPLA